LRDDRAFFKNLGQSGQGGGVWPLNGQDQGPSRHFFGRGLVLGATLPGREKIGQFERGFKVPKARGFLIPTSSLGLISGYPYFLVVNFENMRNFLGAKFENFPQRGHGWGMAALSGPARPLESLKKNISFLFWVFSDPLVWSHQPSRGARFSQPGFGAPLSTLFKPLAHSGQRQGPEFKSSLAPGFSLQGRVEMLNNDSSFPQEGWSLGKTLIWQSLAQRESSESNVTETVKLINGIKFNMKN
jgi:hypothetical protein